MVCILSTEPQVSEEAPKDSDGAFVRNPRLTQSHIVQMRRGGYTVRITIQYPKIFIHS